MRWGQGSLQEIDHVPFVAPLTRSARTVESTADIPGALDEAFAAAVGPPSGPTFVDFPLDHVFMESDVDADSPAKLLDHRSLPAADGVERAIELLKGAERPAIMAGTGLYWAHGEDALRALAEELRIPVFVNGLGRGCIPADHELAFSRARGKGLKGADVALVVGVPMDFRLGFGGSFGDDTQIVLLDSAEPDRRPPRDPALELYGGIPPRSTPCGKARPVAPTARPGWLPCARPRTRSAPASRPTSTTSARRCIRCASTTSCARCSTATRS